MDFALSISDLCEFNETSEMDGFRDSFRPFRRRVRYDWVCLVRFVRFV